MEAVVSMRGGIRIVQLKGRMSFETVDSFRERCLKDFTTDPIVVNLENLSFVGSNGIGTFLETLVDMAKQTNGYLRLCNVGSEFRRIFEANGLNENGIYDSEEAAIRSFFAPPIAPTETLPTSQLEGTGELSQTILGDVTVNASEVALAVDGADSHSNYQTEEADHANSKPLM